MHNPSIRLRLSPSWEDPTLPLSPSRELPIKKHLALSSMPPQAFHRLSPEEGLARQRLNQRSQLLSPKDPSSPQVAICLQEFLAELRQRLIDYMGIACQDIDLYYGGGQGTQLACGESLYPDTQDLDIFIFIDGRGHDVRSFIAAWADALLLEWLQNPSLDRQELLDNYRKILYFSNRGCCGMAYQLSGIDLTFFMARAEGGFSDSPYHTTANSFLVPLWDMWALSLCGDYEKAVHDVHQGHLDLPLIAHLDGKGLFSLWRYLTWGWRPPSREQKEHLSSKIESLALSSPHYLACYLEEHYANRPLGALLFLLNGHFDLCTTHSPLKQTYPLVFKALSAMAEKVSNTFGFCLSYTQRLLQAKDQGIFLASWIAFLFRSYPDAGLHATPPPRTPRLDGKTMVSRWEQDSEHYLAVSIPDPTAPCQYYLMIPQSLSLLLSDCHQAYMAEDGKALREMTPPARLFACMCRPMSAKEQQLVCDVQQGPRQAGKVWQLFMLALSGSDDGADLGLFKAFCPHPESLALLWASQSVLSLIQEVLPLAKQMPPTPATFHLQARLLWLQHALSKRSPIKETLGLLGRALMVLPTQDSASLLKSLLPLLATSATPFKIKECDAKETVENLAKWCRDSLHVAGTAATLQHLAWALQHAEKIASSRAHQLLARIARLPDLYEIALFLWDRSPQNEGAILLDLYPYLLRRASSPEALAQLFSLGKNLLADSPLVQDVRAFTFFYQLLGKIAQQPSPLLEDLSSTFAHQVPMGLELFSKLLEDDLPQESLALIKNSYLALSVSSLEALYATLALPFDSKKSQALGPRALFLLSSAHYLPSYLSQQRHDDKATLVFSWIEQLAKDPATLPLAYEVTQALYKNGLAAHLAGSQNLAAVFSSALHNLSSFSPDELNIAYFVLTTSPRNLGVLIRKAMPYVFSLSLQEGQKSAWIELFLTLGVKLSARDQVLLWDGLLDYLHSMTGEQAIVFLTKLYKNPKEKTSIDLLQKAFRNFLWTYPSYEALSCIYPLAKKKNIFVSPPAIDPELLITTAQRLIQEEKAPLLAHHLLSHVTMADLPEKRLKEHFYFVWQQWLAHVIQLTPWKDSSLVAALHMALPLAPLDLQLRAFDRLMTYYLDRDIAMLREGSQCLQYFASHASHLARFNDFHSQMLQRFHQHPIPIDLYWAFFTHERLFSWTLAKLDYLLDFPKHIVHQPLLFRSFLDFLKEKESFLSNDPSLLGKVYCNLIVQASTLKDSLPFLETLYQLVQIPVGEDMPSGTLIAIPPQVFQKIFSSFSKISKQLTSSELLDADLKAYHFLLRNLALLWHEKDAVLFSLNQGFSVRQQALDACALLIIHFYELLQPRVHDFPFTPLEVASFTQQKLAICKESSHPMALSHAIMVWAAFLTEQTSPKWLEMGAMILKKLTPYYAFFHDTPSFIKSAYLALSATKNLRSTAVFPMILQEACLDELWQRLVVWPSTLDDIADLAQLLIEDLQVLHPVDKAATLLKTLLINLIVKSSSRVVSLAHGNRPSKNLQDAKADLSPKDEPLAEGMVKECFEEEASQTETVKHTPPMSGYSLLSLAKVCSSLSCLPDSYVKQQQDALRQLFLLMIPSKEDFTDLIPHAWNSLISIARALDDTPISDPLGKLLPGFFITALHYTKQENQRNLALGFLQKALRPWTTDNLHSHAIGWLLFEVLLEEKRDIDQGALLAKRLLTDMYAAAFSKNSLTKEDKQRFKKGILDYAHTFFSVKAVSRKMSFDVLSLAWESDLLCDSPHELLNLDKAWLQGVIDHNDIELVVEYARFYQEALWNDPATDVTNMVALRYGQLANTYTDLATEIGKMLLKALSCHTLAYEELFRLWGSRFGKKNTLGTYHKS